MDDATRVRVGQPGGDLGGDPRRVLVRQAQRRVESLFQRSAG